MNIKKSRAIQTRRFIIFEIFTTEKSYLKHLTTLKKIFMDPFVQTSRPSNPLINSFDIPIIFAHIEDLIILSTVIVDALNNKIHSWDDEESRIGDVFLKYHGAFEVFRRYAENHREKFFNAISLPKLTYHWHTLLLSTLSCYFTIYFSRIISPKLFPKSYNTLHGLKRLNWDIHFVSMIHCLIIVTLSIPLFNEKELVEDKVFGYNYYAGNVYSIACG
ncbi:6168_t:CDS:2 [Diversispora eburnea]|uniref:6168_t:CDS:1 n=1 Tax=Diversispora eburnea TaxID=1213867 RepID=A0A9N8WEL4_9GLOM|nr:6168_t:CDS:2 [Diversispora eburnea]